MIRYVKNNYKYFILITVLAMVFLYFFCNTSEVIGIAVNSEEDVSVGVDTFFEGNPTFIRIYNSSGDLKNRLEIKTSGTFEFGYENDILKILCARGTTRYNYDFNGNLLSKQPYEYQEYHDLMYSERNKIITQSGNTYLHEIINGYSKVTKITSDGKEVIIYKTPTDKYAAKIIFALVIYIAVCVLIHKLSPYFKEAIKKKQRLT